MPTYHMIPAVIGPHFVLVELAWSPKRTWRKRPIDRMRAEKMVVACPLVHEAIALGITNKIFIKCVTIFVFRSIFTYIISQKHTAP